jgi:hypothetical protein
VRPRDLEISDNGISGIDFDDPEFGFEEENKSPTKVSPFGFRRILADYI